MKTMTPVAGCLPQVAASAANASNGTAVCQLSVSRRESARFYESRRWVSKKATIRRRASRAEASW